MSSELLVLGREERVKRARLDRVRSVDERMSKMGD